MFKRIAALVVAAGVTSALLLYVGTTLMGQFSSAYASSLPALIAGSGRGGVDDTPHTVPTTPASTPDARRGANKPEDGLLDNRSGANKPEDTLSTVEVTANPDPDVTPAAKVTIAQLLAGSAQFEDGVFTLTGIATRVNDDKFLLNDGTGQILVDLEDNQVKVTILDGGMVTVTGEFRQLGGQNGLGLKACVLTNQDGSVTLDTCEAGRHGENEPLDDHGGSINPTSGVDDHGGSISPTPGIDDHGGSSNSGSGSSGSNSGSGKPEDHSGSGSGSGKP